MKKLLFRVLIFTTPLMAELVATPVSGIINSNTTWTPAGSPYELTGKVQVANGVTLTIAAGSTVSGGTLEVFGNLAIVGTQPNPVIVSQVSIAPGPNSAVAPSSMDIRYANINGGSIWAPTGNAVYGSVSVRDSVLVNLSYLYLWYPVANCNFERNTFIRSGGFSIGIGSGGTAPTITIRNNVFFNPRLDALGPGSTTGAAITCWASYSGSIVVDANSFLNFTEGYALKLPTGYSSVRLSAPNNYWGNLSIGEIAGLIFDQTKDLGSGGTIVFQPILQAADSATPPPPSVPAIFQQPAAQSVNEGGNVLLSVGAMGNPAVSYQWAKNGVPIAGATTSTLNLQSVPLSSAGTYSVTVSNAAGSLTSAAVALTVLPNASVPVITGQPVGSRVVAGQAITLSVGYTSQGIATFQWRKNGIPIAGATYQQYSISSVAVADGGAYDVVVTNSTGSVSSAVATMIVDPGRMKNLSVRTVVADNGILIAGFVIDSPKALLIRGIGRTLEQFGVQSGTTMQNPSIEVHNTSGDVVAQNDDAIASATSMLVTARAGAFALSSAKDAALVVTLPTGAYTVHLKPADGKGGDSLIEVYDVDGLNIP